MIGMKVREECCVELSTVAAGAEQALRHAATTVDEKALAAGANEVGGTVAVEIDLRTAGPEQSELHQHVFYSGDSYSSGCPSLRQLGRRAFGEVLDVRLIQTRGRRADLL